MANKLQKLYEKQHSFSDSKSAMGALLAKKTTAVSGFKKGDIVSGTITKLTRSEILVNISGKTEAVVLEKDRQLLNNILAALNVGDTVTVTILNPESDTGNAVVSLRRFMDEKAWTHLGTLAKSQEQIQVNVLDVTKGGYLIRLPNGMNGFLPFSHVSPTASTQPSVGKTVSAFLLDLKKEDNRIIVSQKQLLTDEEFTQVKKQYKKDSKETATVAAVTSFGVFVVLPFTTAKKEEKVVEGLIHQSQVSWEKGTDIAQVYQPGGSIDVKIIGFDDEGKRIDLSIKQLTEDPFEAIVKKYPVDTKVQGKVTKVSGGNVTVQLEEGIDGIIKKEKVPPTTMYEVGQSITVLVSDIDTKYRTINLSPVLLEKPMGYR
ncbi:MAG: 30S ribosomal protein S1 [Candidatus Levybacteria bacterium]|nr:30S ribosomal protein S1 [Candidatus Levybacteria bacterium]